MKAYFRTSLSPFIARSILIVVKFIFYLTHFQHGPYKTVLKTDKIRLKMEALPVEHTYAQQTAHVICIT